MQIRWRSAQFRCRSAQFRWQSGRFQWQSALVLLLIACFFIFILIYYYVLDNYNQVLTVSENHLIVDSVNNGVIRDIKNTRQDANEVKVDGDFSYLLHYRGKDIYIESVLTHSKAESLQQRVTLDPSLTKTRRVIKAVDLPFNQANLGGCFDWNCELSGGSGYADVIIMQSPRPKYGAHRNHTIYAFYSQESVQNSLSLKQTNLFNMFLGFRHDSPAASPYGYTAKLAPQSRKSPHASVVDQKLINNKTKAIAWFVSHCHTHSRRELLVKELQKHIQVDIYGSCGSLKCQKGTECEKLIDKNYYFYLSVENSICEDYITEKLWNQGYGHTVVPIVLKRSLVEPYSPPMSFIAFDDYENMEAMGKHLNQLMADKEAYSKYFNWRRDYIVIYLNGLAHDALERPWGFCQLCRIAQLIGSGMSPQDIPLFNQKNLSNKWDNSCNKDGVFANSLLQPSPNVKL